MGGTKEDRAGRSAEKKLSFNSLEIKHRTFRVRTKTWAALDTLLHLFLLLAVVDTNQRRYELPASEHKRGTFLS